MHIRINDLPQLQAGEPECVQEVMDGLVLPVFEQVQSDDGVEIVDTYAVNFSDLLEAVKKKNSDAYAWFVQEFSYNNERDIRESGKETAFLFSSAHCATVH